MISWTNENRIQHIHMKVCGMFEYDPSSIVNLAHVPADLHWFDRTRIESKEQLDELYDVISKLPSHRMGTFYCYVGPESPQGSPPTTPPASESVSSISDLTLDSNTSTSSQKQQAMRDRLLLRDPHMCRVCRRIDTVECAHIVDVQYKMPADFLMRELHLNDVYDHANGLLLCSICRKKYDNFYIGIDPYGNVLNRVDDEIYNNIFEDIKSFVDPRVTACLEFKFRVFLKFHEEAVKSKYKTKKLTAKQFLGTFPFEK